MGFDGYELFGKRGFGESIYRFRLFIPFLCNPIDWIAEPIQNYEMVVCGNGKLVYLRRKLELDDVLRVGFYDTEEEKSYHLKSVLLQHISSSPLYATRQ